MEYNSERELFEDLKGAFKVKLRMIEGKYDNISMLDIYDYLKLNKWRYAKDLTISEHTAKAHVCNVIQKLVVDDRTQAAVKALKEGLV